MTEQQSQKKEEEKVEKIRSNEEKKTLTLKNSDLEGLTASEGLSNLKQNKNLPIVFSFRLADLMGKLQSTIKAYMEQKQKLVEKYGDKDKDGKLIQASPGMFMFTTKAQWFQKEFTELLNLTFTLDCEKLQLSMEDIPKGIISADDIIALMPIINFLKE